MFEPDIVKVVSHEFCTKVEIITYLSKLAYKAEKITNVEKYVEAVLEREELASTAVGYGIAIPHGEANEVKETFVACLHLEHPFTWDNEVVNLVFMIGVPLSSRNKEHLKILAMLSRHLMIEDFRKELLASKTDETFYESIKVLENEN